MCTAIVLLKTVLFSDFHVATAVVVFLNSLLVLDIRIVLLPFG